MNRILQVLRNFFIDLFLSLKVHIGPGKQEGKNEAVSDGNVNSDARTSGQKGDMPSDK